MKTRRPTASLLAWSLIGLLGGHQAAYLAVYRDPAVVAHVLRDTGHGWMWLAPLLAASAALTVLIVGLRGTAPVQSFRLRFAALAVIQASTFVAVESCERLPDGTDGARLVDDLLAGSGWLVLLLGLGFQVVAAFLLALASRVVERIAGVLRRRRRRSPRPAVPAARHAPSSVTLPINLGLARSCPPRAPPVPA